MSKSTPKILALLGAAALIALAIAALPAPASAHRADKDCINFRDQKAAQIFFIKHGGTRYDPDDLDGDDDGIACEDNSCPCYFKDRLPQRYEGRSGAYAAERQNRTVKPAAGIEPATS